MKFALATNNPGKISEMHEILSEFGYEIVTRNDLGIDLEIEETGTTFYDNALAKATAICDFSGLAAIADDSGLCVESLNGAPGVYSSSFGGKLLTDAQRCDYLLKKMVNMEHRRAKFVCNILCVFPGGTTLATVGECYGSILTSRQGTGGFGYDPVFQPDGINKSMSQLSRDQKNSISHRGAALTKFAALLRQMHIS